VCAGARSHPSPADPASLVDAEPAQADAVPAARDVKIRGAAVCEVDGVLRPGLGQAVGGVVAVGVQQLGVRRAGKDVAGRGDPAGASDHPLRGVAEAQVLLVEAGRSRAPDDVPPETLLAVLVRAEVRGPVDLHIAERARPVRNVAAHVLDAVVVRAADVHVVLRDLQVVVEIGPIEDVQVLGIAHLLRVAHLGDMHLPPRFAGLRAVSLFMQ